ncbi:MAG: alpha/beta fold hydrolase [Syntrophales bacterium]|nr:alpha/beta fold hydrolase [Syntrophales bacterium]MDD4338279.1 alpha/beta fold hydrolase [Syntrophales bacterium]HPB70275.1 alpha/beta fold hydrolase [Syntrophales bacterium]HQN24825.1 alpha/beta fold hydrolase [Syntrophales bacterium]HQP28714.1 alpha/beta fold hydrolase [Syntrophales bacterium]
MKRDRFKNVSTLAAEGSSKRRIDHFDPGPVIRNPHLQSILASLKLRVLGPNPLVTAARELILDAGGGVRLQGFWSRHDPPTRGLVAMIHGWEGSAASAYMLSCGRALFRRGFDVFRLNLRDHGDSHHLNKDLFHGARIDEVFQAVIAVAALSPGMPFFIVGFSLGGNFALRIGLRAGNGSLPTLRRIFSISPALDPYKATLAIDRGPALYRHYFLHKWKRSLRRKQALFPNCYDFSAHLSHTTLIGLTEALMSHNPEYENYTDYFRAYTLTDALLVPLSVPVTMITSRDDPVVPVEDFYPLGNNARAEILIQPYGGHCGFMQLYPPGCWYEPWIAARMLDELEEAFHRSRRNPGGRS